MDLFTFLKFCRSDIWNLSIPDGYAGAKGIKLVRHADARWDLKRLLASGHFEEYQARQVEPVFQGARYVVSLFGEHGSRSRFTGVYEVLGVAADVPEWPGTSPTRTCLPARFATTWRSSTGFRISKNASSSTGELGCGAGSSGSTPRSRKASSNSTPRDTSVIFPGTKTWCSGSMN
jgi:hypothetical protein